jgi:hypothetical protein
LKSSVSSCFQVPGIFISSIVTLLSFFIDFFILHIISGSFSDDFSICSVQTRRFAAPATPGVYKEKSTMEVWCGDKGAWPVMSVIVFACVFCAGFGFWVMFNHPDARISKRDRKSPMRGEFVGEN